MKTRIILAVLFLLMIIISAAGSISFVKAEAFAEPKVSYTTWGEESLLTLRLRGSELGIGNLAIMILSPVNNEVLDSNNATVKINIGTQIWPINSVYYEADWQEGKHCIYNISNGTLNNKMYYRLAITANFTEIPDGKHHITIYANIHDGSHGSASIDFTVNAPPKIAILSPGNITYNAADFPLNFTVNEPASWFGYSLDGKENLTVTGNGTIANLANGLHQITVYANDSSGNMGASQTMTFSVDVPKLYFTQTAIVVSASIALAAAVSVGLLVYRKKHKNRS